MGHKLFRISSYKKQNLLCPANGPNIFNMIESNSGPTLRDDSKADHQGMEGFNLFEGMEEIRWG